VVTIGGLVAWNARYATQAQRRAQKK